MLPMPLIVYLQTITNCNGHCWYCPFDDVYSDKPVKKMSLDCYKVIIEWLKSNNYKGRIGYLLHCEPLMDSRLGNLVDYARKVLPEVFFEIATNGIIRNDAILSKFNVVDCISAGSKKTATSRAGNCKATPETAQHLRLVQPPCPVSTNTMPIAANGDVLLCCQDWRHEAVVGTYKDLTAARTNQLKFAEKAKKLELEICRDCMDGKTAEEVGDRLGRRFL